MRLSREDGLHHRVNQVDQLLSTSVVGKRVKISAAQQ